MNDYTLPDRLEVELDASPLKTIVRCGVTGSPVLRIWNLDLHWTAGELTTAAVTYYNPDNIREAFTQYYQVFSVEGNRVELLAAGPAEPLEIQNESA